MRTKEFENAIALRLDVGDEIIESVKYACEKHGVSCGVISGIGASKSAVIGVYDVEKQSYNGKTVDEFCEIASLNGNVSTMNGELYLHLHAVLGGESGVFAGHLQSAVIGATAEIFISPLNGTIERKRNDEVGINIFDF